MTDFDEAQHGVDMHDAEIERRAMHEEAFALTERKRDYEDHSPAAEAEWRAEESAARFEESGGTYLEGLADLKRRSPWLWNRAIPEPSDGGFGQDPRIVSTDVDWPVLPNDESGPWWKIA